MEDFTSRWTNTMPIPSHQRCEVDVVFITDNNGEKSRRELLKNLMDWMDWHNITIFIHGHNICTYMHERKADWTGGRVWLDGFHMFRRKAPHKRHYI